MLYRYGDEMVSFVEKGVFIVNHCKEVGFALYPWVNDLSPQSDYFLSLWKFALN